jgi:hypothetical protein
MLTFVAILQTKGRIAFAEGSILLYRTNAGIRPHLLLERPLS